MFDWISANKDVLNVLIGFGTLLVWVVYAQLLYNGYSRQRRPHVLINRGQHSDHRALCLISNMSAEAIFIQNIVVYLDTDRGLLACDVTELERNLEDKEERSGGGGHWQALPLSQGTRQGPLGPGEVEHIGTFRDVIERVARQRQLVFESCPPDEGRTGVPARLYEITFRILAIYGSDNLPIGVERGFIMRDDGCLVPRSWDSKRIKSWWRRRALRAQLASLAAGETPER